MKAAVLYGKEDVRIEETAERPLVQGEVRIRIEAALTCGTDLKVYKRGYHAKMIVPPAVFGHELSGIIEEVAPGAKGWSKGDRVVVANSAPCNECFFCRQHQEYLCEDLLFLNGAYAQRIAVPARLVSRNMLRLRAGTPFRDAALVEPLACVVQGVEDTGLKGGENVLIIGAGPIGLMFVALARHLGCAVTVLGRGEARLKTAARLGAERVIDAAACPAVELEQNPRRWDVVIEAVGKPETWADAIRLVRKGGKVNLFGGCPSGTTVPLDTALMHYSALTLLASFHHTPRSIRKALDLVEQGVVRSGDFIGGECALDDLPMLFRDMSAGNRVVKTLIKVQDGVRT